MVLNLCFHGIGEPGRTLEPGEADYWVSRELFLATLELVEDRPEVHLSFDDGNDSDATVALPALAQRGLRGDFYVLAGRFDQAGSLSRGQVHELAAAGMGIGSHGMHHRSWRGISPAVAAEELSVARGRIEDAAGVDVDAAACPLGQYDRTVLRRLRREGFARVMTSDRADARMGAWLQPRFSVRAHDSLATVRDIIQSPPRLGNKVGARARMLAKAMR